MQRIAISVFAASVLMAGTPTIAQVRCALERSNSEPSSLRFEIDGSIVSAFEAQTVVSSDSPDLRPGYAAWTCHRSLRHFEQANEGQVLVLKHRPPQAQDDESHTCKVAFRVTDKTIRVFTSGCKTSCMGFDFTFQKTGKLCRDG